MAIHDEVHQKNNTATPKQAAVASAIGTSMEFYDFTIYGTAAALVFGDIFFHQSSAASATMAALASYSVAFFARPLGGVLFGYLGDRVGRRKNMLITVVAMGIGTFLIGCLPSVQSIGLTAPVLLVLLRFLQGLAVGGEWGGAALMTLEHAPEKQRGFYGSFVQLGSPIGSLLASLAFYLVSVFGEGDLAEFAWRIPFLASPIFLFVGLYIRLRVPESPEFAAATDTNKLSKNPIGVIWSKYRMKFVLSIGASLLPTGGFYFVAVYLLLVYGPSVGVSESIALLAGVVLNIATMLTINVYGYLGDRFGTKRVAIIGGIYTMVSSFPMFFMISSGSLVLILLAVPLCYAGANAMFAVASVIIGSVFPAEVRNTGVSSAYQISAMISAAPAPMLATWLQTISGGAAWPVVLFLTLLAAISTISIAALGLRYSASDSLPRGKTKA